MESNLRKETLEYSRKVANAFISSDGKLIKDDMDALYTLKILIEKFERINNSLMELDSIKEVWLKLL